MRAFLDTNVLVYALLSDDPRREVAEQLVLAGGVISVQVLNEFANVARNKLKWPWPDIAAAVTLLRGRMGHVASLTAETNALAVRLAGEHGLAFYDGLIVAAALEAGCDLLWSEDMQDGRTLQGLTIRNPFRTDAV